MKYELTEAQVETIKGWALQRIQWIQEEIDNSYGDSYTKSMEKYKAENWEILKALKREPSA